MELLRYINSYHLHQLCTVNLRGGLPPEVAVVCTQYIQAGQLIVIYVNHQWTPFGK